MLAGHVSDWYGRRAVLIPGLVLGAVAALLFIVWHSLAGLLLARVLTGVALGASVATATAYIAVWTPGRTGHRPAAPASSPRSRTSAALRWDR